MLSLYVHVPFCVRKCPYCGFYSTQYSPGNGDEFISCLALEAGGYKHDFNRRIFSSIFIGGGTPTALSPKQIERLMNIIQENVHLADDAEFTVEANPNTVTRENLALLLDRGVTRLSLGVQSFSDEVLSLLGRLHTAEQAGDAFRLARRIGFKNIGIDLIYGVPGQTMTQWEKSLEAVIALKPDHVSTYSLSLDEGSRYHHEAEAGRFALPDDEIVVTMYERAVMKLGSAGHGRYEISNFSLPGYECRHNMNYWERGEYLGLGPGAWSFISGRRYSNIADAAEYGRRLSRGLTAVDAQEVVAAESAAREAVLLGLRTMKGLDLDRFEREYGPDLVRLLQTNSGRLKDAGLLRVTEGHLRLTDRGIMLSDEALAWLAV